jgi:hypothetical protein
MTVMKRLILLTAIALLSASPTAMARHGSDDPAGDDRGGDGTRQEVRVKGTCGNGATSKLKLKNDDGGIEAEFEVDRNRSGEKWSVTFARDGQVVVRTKAKTRGRSGSFSVERLLDDLSGADTITARGVGPSGLTCVATATLPAS